MTSHWIPGLGEDKPVPRVLGASFFGYVPDAFSDKTPNLPSERKNGHIPSKGSPQTPQVSSRYLCLHRGQNTPPAKTTRSFPHQSQNHFRIDLVTVKFKYSDSVFFFSFSVELGRPLSSINWQHCRDKKGQIKTFGCVWEEGMSQMQPLVCPPSC